MTKPEPARPPLEPEELPAQHGQPTTWICAECGERAEGSDARKHIEQTGHNTLVTRVECPSNDS